MRTQRPGQLPAMLVYAGGVLVVESTLLAGQKDLRPYPLGLLQGVEHIVEHLGTLHIGGHLADAGAVLGRQRGLGNNDPVAIAKLVNLIGHGHFPRIATVHQPASGR